MAAQSLVIKRVAARRGQWCVWAGCGVAAAVVVLRPGSRRWVPACPAHADAVEAELQPRRKEPADV